MLAFARLHCSIQLPRCSTHPARATHSFGTAHRDSKSCTQTKSHNAQKARVTQSAGGGRTPVSRLRSSRGGLPVGLGRTLTPPRALRARPARRARVKQVSCLTHAADPAGPQLLDACSRAFNPARRSARQRSLQSVRRLLTAPACNPGPAPGPPQGPRCARRAPRTAATAPAAAAAARRRCRTRRHRRRARGPARGRRPRRGRRAARRAARPRCARACAQSARARRTRARAPAAPRRTLGRARPACRPTPRARPTRRRRRAAHARRCGGPRCPVPPAGRAQGDEYVTHRLARARPVTTEKYGRRCSHAQARRALASMPASPVQHAVTAPGLHLNAALWRAARHVGCGALVPSSQPCQARC